MSPGAAYRFELEEGSTPGSAPAAPPRPGLVPIPPGSRAVQAPPLPRWMPALPPVIHPSWPLRVDVGGEEGVAGEVRQRLATAIAQAGALSGIKVLDLGSCLLAASPGPCGAPPRATLRIGVAASELETARRYLIADAEVRARWLLVTSALVPRQPALIAGARAAGVVVLATDLSRRLRRPRGVFRLPERALGDLFWVRLTLRAAELYRRGEL